MYEIPTEWKTVMPWTETVEADRVFYYYDGPLVFSVPLGPLHLLFVRWIDIGDREMFLVSVADDGLLDALSAGEISLRGAVLEDLRFAAQMEGERLVRAWDLAGWPVPPKTLPASGVAISAGMDPAPDVLLRPGRSAVRLGRAVRHLKRGSVHGVLTERASVQSDTPIVEGDEVVVYIGEEGRVWIRPPAEFDDGRFVPVHF